MKVTIKNESKSSEIKYPCLMQSVIGCIVLFDKPDSGTVMQDKEYAVGSYHTDWATDRFTPFTGTIELSND